MESALSSGVISEFIRRNHERVGLVILSRPAARGIVKTAQSGIKFSMFLARCFILAPYSRRLLGTCDSPGIVRVCSEYRIPCHQTRDVNRPEVSSRLRELQIDLVVSCLFDQILQDDFIGIPARGCLNIHPGLLPECRGVFPEVHTAAGKCSDFGFTIHTIEDASIDRGRMLYRQAIATGHRDILSISRKLLGEGLGALEGVIDNLDSYLAKARYTAGGQYFSMPNAADVEQMEQAGYRLL